MKNTRNSLIIIDCLILDRIVLVMVCGVFALVFPSCSASPSAGGYSPPAPVVASAQNLYVLEFDQEGRSKDNESVKLVLDKLGDYSNPLVITYVHGWRHNAHPEDTNFKQFAAFIEKRQHENRFGGRQVVGVYLGWPGIETGDTRVEEMASFWERQAVADVVALRGDVVGIVGRISDRIKGKGGRTVLVGHSLGGRIIEQSYANLGVSRIPENQFAILVNPASSYRHSERLRDRLKGQHRPLVVSLVARNDAANRILYVAANKFPNLGNADLFRELGKSNEVVMPAGFARSFVTHYLDPINDVERAILAKEEVRQEKRESMVKDRIRSSLDGRDRSLLLAQAEKLRIHEVPSLDGLADLLDPLNSLDGNFPQSFRQVVRSRDSGRVILPSSNSERYACFQWMLSNRSDRNSPNVLSSTNISAPSTAGYWTVTVSEKIMHSHSHIGVRPALSKNEEIFSDSFADMIEHFYTTRFSGF